MAYIIKTPDELKDPFLCYCIFERFDQEAGEDYLDCNASIINPYPFVMWLFGKGYIGNDMVECLLAPKDSVFGLTPMDVLQDDTLFPNTCGQGRISRVKSYSLLAEYMSITKEMRQRLYDSVNDKATSFMDDEFYKDENGVSLACIIEDRDINGEGYTKEQFMKEYPDTYMLPLRDQWNIVSAMSIEEADEFED